MNLFRKERTFKGNLLELPIPHIKHPKKYKFINFTKIIQMEVPIDYVNLKTRQQAIDHHLKLHIEANQIIKGDFHPFSLRLLDNFNVFNYHNIFQSIQERTIESETFALFSEIRDIQDSYLKFSYVEDLKDFIPDVDIDSWGNIFLNFISNVSFTFSTNIIKKIFPQTKNFIDRHFLKENSSEYKEVFNIDIIFEEEIKENWIELLNLDLLSERKKIFSTITDNCPLKTFLKSENSFERIKKAEAISFLEKEGWIQLFKDGGLLKIKKKSKILKKNLNRKSCPRSLIICTYNKRME